MKGFLASVIEPANVLNISIFMNSDFDRSVFMFHQRWSFHILSCLDELFENWKEKKEKLPFCSLREFSVLKQSYILVHWKVWRRISKFLLSKDFLATAQLSSNKKNKRHFCVESRSSSMCCFVHKVVETDFSANVKQMRQARRQSFRVNSYAKCFYTAA